MAWLCALWQFVPCCTTSYNHKIWFIPQHIVSLQEIIKSLTWYLINIIMVFLICLCGSPFCRNQNRNNIFSLRIFWRFRYVHFGGLILLISCCPAAHFFILRIFFVAGWAVGVGLLRNLDVFTYGGMLWEISGLSAANYDLDSVATSQRLVSLLPDKRR